MLPLIHDLPITLPLEDPILKFMLIMAIVLAAPLILNKLKIPYLLGLIIAGAVIGPHGLNLVLRDSSIILSGTAGLLYIMFSSGLEMDMADFKRNSWRSLVFGLYTFSVPMLFGIVAGRWILGYSLHTSILLAALFASQTLVAYPIVSRLGITRDRAVNIAVGGTIITDILALSVLTVIVGIATGQAAGTAFWTRLGVSVILCVGVIIGVFPLVGRWFFKRCSDNVSQYVFVLVMVFLGAYLAQAAGLEPIIGAFLAGLAMNRLIPKSSALMNRIEFVGNAIFIPFFLIGVGMLIDYRAFFRSWETIEVSAVMIVMVTAAKYIAACLTARTFRLSRDQRTVIFGLSSAHVAATLAAVMVGYNVILGHTPDGEPIRLLNENILNGTILMILATCTVSTFATQRGAHNIALKGAQQTGDRLTGEHVLLPVSHKEDIDEMVALGTALTKQKVRSLYGLKAVDNRIDDPEVQKEAEALLARTATAAAAAGIHLHRLLRYDVNIVNAIVGVVRERNITDLVLGMHREQEGAAQPMMQGMLGTPLSPLGKTIPAVLGHTNVTTFIYRSAQPLQTIRRHIVFVPRKAELEAGFKLWLLRIRHLAHDTGAQIVFYATESTIRHLRGRRRRNDIASYVAFNAGWDDLSEALRTVIRKDDCVWIVMSRRDRISYQTAMTRIPGFLEEHLPRNSYVMVYPVQAGDTEKRYLA